ncbi:uncharacterized protein BJ171DRAFT_584776 [Polychytrium aggregatum]|uniref:uncharacterized protein n=1 Tax=Polychytrium aggregatum TaxID=110093 RepID=UPI0022FE0A69|nr:uncharacterized protein BJ171DRAFT_584776 [Polychytrium aggregatum]KAI9201880.1 hypothetical protein BJ171DRAFT_584776 [Polychytrium aggregatum]
MSYRRIVPIDRRSSHARKKDRKHKKEKKEKKDKKKKSKKSKKESSSDSSDGDSDGPRSAITGKKIKLKVSKSSEDKARDKNRQDLLLHLNQMYD